MGITLKQIGKGSSRTVYDQGSNVLKVAKGESIRLERGLAQNRAEYQIYEKSQYDGITCLCPIVSMTNTEEQLVMKKALRISVASEVPDELREKLRAFKRQLKYMYEVLYGRRKQDIPAAIRTFRKYYADKPDKLKEFNKAVRSKLFQDIMILVFEYGLMLGDLERLSSWGYYKGKFVLIDYGGTREVLNEHYGRRLSHGIAV